MPTSFVLNGERQTSHAVPMTPLLDVLRDEFGLTGAKPVCREGFCGACTVHVDGAAIVSCLKPVGVLADADICTVESLASAELSPLQQAFQEHDVVQCGMCFPGILMTLTAFLRDRPDAGMEEIRAALVGNICRCTGYERVVAAAFAMAQRS